MARVVLAPYSPPSDYPALPLTAGSADLTPVAADPVNFNAFVSTGREMLVVNNSGVAVHHITIHSAPDQFGRSGDITTYAVGAGKTSAFPPLATQGWKQADGNVWVDGDDATLLLSVIRLPSIS